MDDILLKDELGIPEYPTCDPEVVEDLLTGHTIIRRLFLKSQEQVGRNKALVKSGEPSPPVLLIRNGYAVRSCITASGRRSIVDVFVPGDICAPDHAFTKYPSDEIKSIGLVRFHAVTASTFRGLFLQPPAALRIATIITEARYRIERAAAMKA